MANKRKGSLEIKIQELNAGKRLLIEAWRKQGDVVIAHAGTDFAYQSGLQKGLYRAVGLLMERKRELKELLAKEQDDAAQGKLRAKVLASGKWLD